MASETHRMVLATSNAHKIEEITAILKPVGWSLLTGRDFPHPPPDPEESGDSYEANALIKAWAWAQATGLPALSDDSGLEVNALQGAPGIHSARYAPTAPARIARLLEALRATPADNGARAARFVCCAVVAWPRHPPGESSRATCALLEKVHRHRPRSERGENAHFLWLIFKGECPGAISHSPSGAQGFGYDPVFLVEGWGGLTMAELSDEEKNRVSHRGRALAAFMAAMENALQ